MKSLTPDLTEYSPTRRRGSVAVHLAEGADLENWDALVRSLPGARVFHTRAWVRSIAEYTGAQPLFLMFRFAGATVGCLPGLLVQKFGVRLFGSPLMGWQTGAMGPLFRPGEVETSQLMAAAVGYLETTHRVQHIELISSNLEEAGMLALGFEKRPVFTQRIPLFPGDPDRALRNIHGKTRNQLRKAIKLGLKPKIETGEGFVDEFYDQVGEVFTRRGKAVPFGKGRALALFRHMSDSGNLLALSVCLPDSGVRIATGVFLLYGKEAYLWMWTHRRAHGSLCPTELLMWTAMTKAMEAGCTSFDMAGGGEAKGKFGALPDHSAIRWLRSRNAWLRASRRGVERAYRLQQAFRGRLKRLLLKLRHRAAKSGHSGQ